jgi:hypothetical protein
MGQYLMVLSSIKLLSSGIQLLFHFLPIKKFCLVLIFDKKFKQCGSVQMKSFVIKVV